MTEPVPLLTVGDLKSDLSRWSNDTPVTFRSPLKEQEFRFYRYQHGDKVLVLEINEFPETSPQVRRVLEVSGERSGPPPAPAGCLR